MLTRIVRRGMSFSSRLDALISTLILLGVAYGIVKVENVNGSDRLRFLSSDSGWYLHYLSVQIYPLFKVFAIVLIIATISLVVFPVTNILVLKFFFELRSFLFDICSFSGLLPLGLGVTLANMGIAVGVIWTIILVVILLARVINVFNKNVLKKLHKINLINAIIMLIVLNLILAIAEQSVNHEQIVITGMLGSFLYPIIYDVLIDIFIGDVEDSLSWYYIAKYSTEYRLYYKIPDKAWYLSEKLAAKHPHVYPPVEENHITKN